MFPKFIPTNREQQYLFPPSVQDWLPEVHLARFVVKIVSQLNLQPFAETYAGKGCKAYHPKILRSLLFYGYATGVFSIRKIDQATYDSVAFCFISANTHPDRDTIAATFRKRFHEELKPLFTQILMVAHEMGLLKLGKVSLDGTKIKANASKHHALSSDHASNLEQQLQAEVNEHMHLAEQADTEHSEEMDIPKELHRRQDRLNAITKAKATIEKRAATRHAQEQKEYEEKTTARREKAEASGKKPHSPESKPPTPGPRKKDQVNLTEEEFLIMPSSDKGFVQAYNAQLSVDVHTMLIVEAQISQASKDNQEIITILSSLNELPEELGRVDTILADAGCFSESNVAFCNQCGFEPFIPPSRDKHNQPLPNVRRPSAAICRCKAD